jgi:catechol 2,3-dioxygenase-like lactoylglutathione lyase family enzyme
MSQPMFKRLFHVNICVSDMTRSIAFYERLGFKKVGDFILGGGTPGIGVALGLDVKQLRGVFMRLGDDPQAPVLDLVQFIDPPAQGQPYPTLNNIGICRIAFLVDDIAAVYEQLKTLEVEFVAPLNMFDGPRRSKIGVLCFKDPDGTILELISSEIEATMVSE